MEGDFQGGQAMAESSGVLVQRVAEMQVCARRGRSDQGGGMWRAN